MPKQALRAGDWLERLGMGASLLCLIHCLALPLVFAALPALSSLLAIPETFHLWVLAAAIPSSGLALLSGRSQHGAGYPLGTGVLGLALLATAVLAFGSSGLEMPITVAGSLSLAFAHVSNWRLRHRAHDKR